ncbi:SMR family transporter [Bacillus paralicheniformis]|uniref:SMR family transporter n=1 Tax=Bacillus paralicheniformis TaxID=1648923 RepID=UPI0029C6A019|nr:SMR family transporter [Bacillus paralicheniformis]
MAACHHHGEHPCPLGLFSCSSKRVQNSLVYPIARGTGPLLTCVLAVAFFGESLTLPAIIGILLIDQHSFFHGESEAVKRIRLVHTGFLRAGGRRYYCRIYPPR